MAVIAAGCVTLGGVWGATAAGGGQPAPVTLAVVNPADSGEGYSFADGMLAWFPRHPSCGGVVRVLVVATGKAWTGGCDLHNNPVNMAIAGRGVVWSTYEGGNTESYELVYLTARGGTKRLAAYHDTGCDVGESCGVDVFAAGARAFVVHGDTVFQVEGLRLKAGVTSGRFAGASWPLVALAARTSTSVYRLTDGRQDALIHDVGTSVVLSKDLLAVRDLISTSDVPRETNRIYDLHTGRRVAVIRDEDVVAIAGRRIISLAPPPAGPRFRLHSVVPLRRIVERAAADGHPRLLVVAGGDVIWAAAVGSRLLWIEQTGSACYPCGVRLRGLNLAR